jgi:hypothetical protein
MQCIYSFQFTIKGENYSISFRGAESVSSSETSDDIYQTAKREIVEYIEPWETGILTELRLIRCDKFEFIKCRWIFCLA